MSYTGLENVNQKRHRTKTQTVRNVTQNLNLPVDYTKSGLLTIESKHRDSLCPGDVIQTKRGFHLISDDGELLRPGLLTFRAPLVRYFCKLYRLYSGAADTFGRQDSTPILVADQLPVCIHDMKFFSLPVAVTGDILEFPSGESHLVRGTSFVNPHLVMLATAKQHSASI